MVKQSTLNNTVISWFRECAFVDPMHTESILIFEPCSWLRDPELVTLAVQDGHA